VPTGEERSDDAPTPPTPPTKPSRARRDPHRARRGARIDDFDAVATLGGVCDRLGIDVISAGNAVAWAVRASDAGLIDPADHGVDRGLSFGDEAAAKALIEEIAARSTPLGDALADGVARRGGAVRRGRPRADRERNGAGLLRPAARATMALAFATGDRGGCHRRARPVETEAVADPGWTPEERAAVVANEQNRRAALWCLVGDDFLAESFGPGRPPSGSPPSATSATRKTSDSSASGCGRSRACSTSERGSTAATRRGSRRR